MRPNTESRSQQGRSLRIEDAIELDPRGSLPDLDHVPNAAIVARAVPPDQGCSSITRNTPSVAGDRST